MKKLRRVKTDRFGILHELDGRLIADRIRRMSNLLTIVLKNPVINIESEIDKMVERKSPIIPEYSDAYEVSDFNPDTQFVRDDKSYSCYAIRFYTNR